MCEGAILTWVQYSQGNIGQNATKNDDRSNSELAAVSFDPVTWST